MLWSGRRHRRPRQRLVAGVGTLSYSGDAGRTTAAAAPPPGPTRTPALHAALCPTTIADRLEDMADSAGVLVLGSPPPAEPVVRMPKPVKSFAPVELPGSALTARDAVDVLEPFVREWAPDATLLILTGSVLDFALDERPTQGPWIGEDGRTTSTVGWWLLCRSATPPLRAFVMTLTQREQAPLWRVNYLCVQSGMMRRELQLTLHATTGEVISVVSSD